MKLVITKQQHRKNPLCSENLFRLYVTRTNLPTSWQSNVHFFILLNMDTRVGRLMVNGRGETSFTNVVFAYIEFIGIIFISFFKLILERNFKLIHTSLEDSSNIFNHKILKLG